MELSLDLSLDLSLWLFTFGLAYWFIGKRLTVLPQRMRAVWSAAQAFDALPLKVYARMLKSRRTVFCIRKCPPPGGAASEEPPLLLPEIRYKMH